MKNFNKTFKQYKQRTQFYQGTSVFFGGIYTRLVCHTQKVPIFNNYVRPTFNQKETKA